MNLTFTELDNLDYQEQYQNEDSYNKTYYDSLKSTINTTSIPVVDYENQIMQEIKPILKSKEVNTKLNQNQELKLKLQSLRIQEKPKKKSISYDDILASMNTVVIDGKLEFIRKDLLHNVTTQNQGQQSNPNKKVTFTTPPQQQQQQQQFNKNSYIYNKYFKDYKDPSQDENQTPQRPLTKNELRRKIIQDYANRINERNRVSQIKSTKLLFTK
jgi:hypothetical protein